MEVMLKCQAAGQRSEVFVETDDGEVVVTVGESGNYCGARMSKEEALMLLLVLDQIIECV